MWRHAVVNPVRREPVDVLDMDGQALGRGAAGVLPTQRLSRALIFCLDRADQPCGPSAFEREDP